MTMEVIGSVGGVPTILPDEVYRVLESPRMTSTESGFPGKISTRLFADEHYVLKLKSECSLSYESARQWCEKQLERERSFNIYPHHRHWLIIQGEDGYALANMTRRGTTFENVLLNTANVMSHEALSHLFTHLFKRYFDFWRDHELRQDEGLSNYIVEDGEVYYIDDDIYGRDNLVSLAHGICAWIRRPNFLDALAVRALSKALQYELLRTDTLFLTILAEQVRDVFVPEAKQALRQVLLDYLESPKPGARQRCDARIAILADIHGNLPALEAVIADMEEQGIKQALVLGDMVGYGPFPAECIELLRSKPWFFIKGNHDQAAADGVARAGFSRSASWSLDWTVKRLNHSQRVWLGAHPLLWREGDCLAVHGAPVDPTFFNSYVYANTAEHNLDSLQARNIRICFHGHSHIKGVYRRNNIGLDDFLCVPYLPLRSTWHYLVCPGSVGQPRDGSIHAQYLIFDQADNAIVFREVGYDRGRLNAAICQERLPDFIQRLFGFAPSDSLAALI